MNAVLVRSLCLIWLATPTLAAVRLPSVFSQLKVRQLLPPRFQKKSYTPLVFFKLPPGIVPECDAMEEVIQQVERELNVRVQRLDIWRDPAAEAAFVRLTSSKRPPFLYHRESCQVVHVPPQPTQAEGSSKRRGGRGSSSNSGSSSSSSSQSAAAAAIDKDRVRAWAKGRYLPPVRATDAHKQQTAPNLVVQEERAMDQDELLEDERLTPLQRKGKQAIRERTEASAAMPMPAPAHEG